MNMSMPLVAAIVALSIFIGYEAPHDSATAPIPPEVVSQLARDMQQLRPEIPSDGCVSLPQDLMDLANGKRPEERP